MIKTKCTTCHRPMQVSFLFEENDCQNCYITKLELLEFEKVKTIEAPINIDITIEIEEEVT